MTQTLVTGGGGFIGQHLVAALLAQGRRVRILDLRPPTCPMTGAQFVSGSVLDPELVREALNDVGEVYHLAALPGMWIPRKDDFHAVNCRGTEIMLDAARKRGVSRFLHCSTEFDFCSVLPLRYLPPSNRYTPPLTKCQGPTHARNCSRNSELRKRQRPDSLW